MKTLLAFFVLISGTLANAQTFGPSSFTYEGRVTDSSGSGSAASVSFIIRLLNPSANCVLYEEKIGPRNLADSFGYFSLTLGEGSRNSPNLSTPIRNLILNVSPLTGVSPTDGTACTYTPVSGDSRKLRVTIDESGTLTALTPDVSLGTSPYAMVADTVQGIAPSGFVQTTTDVTQAKANVLFAPANWTELTALFTGASTKYAKTSASGASALPKFSATPATPAAGDIWYDQTTQAVRYFNGTTTQTLGSGAATTLAESDIPPLTTAGKVSGTAINAGTIGGSTSLNTTGTVNAIGLSGQSVGIYESTGVKKVTLQSPASLTADYGLTFPANPPTSGQILSSNGAGALSWVNAGGSGTVTSVALTGPSIFNFTGSPVTNSGAINITLASQAINTVLAAPPGGGTPSFRNLNMADIMSSVSGPFVSPTTCAAGQALVYASVTDNISCANVIPNVASASLSSGKIWVGGAGNLAHEVPVVGDATIDNNGLLTLAPVPVNKGGTGRTTYASNALMSTDGVGAPTAGLTCSTAGYILTWTGATWACQAAQPILWTPSGSDTVFNSGNVGIGTTPAQKLDIQSTDANVIAQLINRNSTAARTVALKLTNYMNTYPSPARVILEASRGAIGAPTAVTNGDPLAEISAAGYDGSTLATGAMITVTASEPWTPSAHGSRIGFTSTNLGTSTPVEAMSINGSNVGIGVTAPVVKLQVAGQIVSNLVTAGGPSVNFTSGNVQINSAVAGTSISLTGMVAGGIYTLIVTDTTAQTYNFTGGQCAGTYFKDGSNPAVTAGRKKIFKIIWAGSNCFIESSDFY
jgi:hypothetical protein